MADLPDTIGPGTIFLPVDHSVLGAKNDSRAGGRRVYLSAARACLPRWLRILGPAPWVGDAAPSGRHWRASPETLYKHLAATLGIALLCKTDRKRPNTSYLGECVRSSLLRWQLSLRGDGKPASRRVRRSPLNAAVINCVILLLRESPRFPNGLFLRDIAGHLQWLARRRESAPWLEASTVVALADGARLIGDTTLRRYARKRIRNLLSLQNSEGWFPEDGGADVGRLSLTLDALARLYQLHRWEELAGPLERSLNFLVQVVHPDGSVGGCINSCDTGFISPYGLELLALRFPEAAGLARLCRRGYEQFDSQRLSMWSDELCAVLGSRIALAAAHASEQLPEVWTDSERLRGRARFPQASLSVYSTDAYHAVVAGRKGASVHVHWRNGAAALEDPGVTVMYPNAIRTSGRFDLSARDEVTPSSVTCVGDLSRVSTNPHPVRRWARRILLVIGSACGSRALEHRGDVSMDRIGHRGPAPGRYMREITFGDDWIKIRDEVACRLPCEAVVCASNRNGREDLWIDRGLDNWTAHPSIFAEGGRRVTLTRLYRNGALLYQRSDCDRSNRQDP